MAYCHMVISISIDLYIMLISISMTCVCHPPCDESSKNYLTRASNESYINFDNTCGFSHVAVRVIRRSQKITHMHHIHI
jgi:hypothetical protein